jgi:hypothetical protein
MSMLKHARSLKRAANPDNTTLQSLIVSREERGEALTPTSAAAAARHPRVLPALIPLARLSAVKWSTVGHHGLSGVVGPLRELSIAIEVVSRQGRCLATQGGR